MKKIATALFAVMIMAASFTGCSDAASGSSQAADVSASASASASASEASTPVEANAPDAAPTGDPIDLVFATMDVGTAIYTYSSSIASILPNYLPAGSTIDLPTTSPGGLAAAYIVAQGKSDLIILNDVGVIWSMDTGVMENPPIEGGIASLASGMDLPHVTVLMREDFISKSGCESMEDLVANKVAANFVIKTAGTLGEAAFTQLIAALGTTEEEMTAWGCTISRTSGGNIKTMMQDGTADIQIDHLPDNQANTVEMTMNTKCRLVPLAETTRDALAAQGWTKTVWASGASGFTGHDADVETVSSSNVLICSADLDEETAYQITKAVCENKETLAGTSSALNVFDPATAWQTLEDILHPGAARYYKEMGYMS